MVKDFFKLLKQNLKTIVGFQFLYTMASLLIVSPILCFSFDLTMKITGYSYLTSENILAFLLNPLTIFLAILTLIFITFYTMFNIATLIIIVDASMQKQKIKMLDAVKIALFKCIKMVSKKNILLILYLLVLIPFINIGVTISFISTIQIPEFILDFIFNNIILCILFVIFMIILGCVLFKWTYSMHYMVLYDDDFKTARAKSAKINYNPLQYFRGFAIKSVIQLCFVLAYCIGLCVGILLICAISAIFDTAITSSIFTSIVLAFMTINFIVFLVLQIPVSYLSTGMLYYSKNKESAHIDIPKTLHKKNKIFKYMMGIIIVLMVIFGSIFVYGLNTGKYNFNIEYVRNMEVSGHRGDSTNCPENTMSAFESAKKLGADWIELDVQQTKDGKIIVMHDSNFSRTTGIDKNVWEVNYDEVKDYDAGSYFDKKFKGEKIPLLEDVIVWAKENNIRLNIEIKPTGHEKNFEKDVIDLIHKYNFDKNCVVTSLEYDVLENLKKYDSSIVTVYVMNIAYGEITQLKYADHFSVEATNVSFDLVNNVHNEGKQLYVWTVNKEDSINSMIDYNVDNIITNDIELAKKLVKESKTSNVVDEYVKAVTDIFA